MWSLLLRRLILLMYFVAFVWELWTYFCLTFSLFIISYFIFCPRPFISLYLTVLFSKVLIYFLFSYSLLLSSTFYFSSIFLYLHIITLNRLMSHIRFIWHLWSFSPLFCLRIIAFFVSSHLSILLILFSSFFISFSFDFSVFLFFLITLSLSSLYMISSFATSYPFYAFRCLRLRALNVFLSHFLFI